MESACDNELARLKGHGQGAAIVGVLNKNETNRTFKGIQRKYLHLTMLAHPDKMSCVLKKATTTDVMKVVSTYYKILDNFAYAIVESGKEKDLREVIVSRTLCVILDDAVV